MKRTRRVAPEIEAQARHLVSMGYQSLLTFERPGGGFNWWCSGDPVVYLTAYGMQEFYDTSKVQEIDLGVLERARGFLFRTQSPDGSWDAVQFLHDCRFASFSEDRRRFALTSYVLWSLLATGTPAEQPEVKKALSWLRPRVAACDDPQVLATAALALLAADRQDADARLALDRLIEHRTQEGKTVHWTGGTSVVSYAGGHSADVETTATVVLALLAAGREPAGVSHALDWIVAAKCASGGWGSTQATILALKALLAAQTGSSDPISGTATVRVNGREAAQWKVTSDDAEVVRAVDARGLLKPADNEVELEWTGTGTPAGQVTARWYRPWSAKINDAPEPFGLSVAYDRTAVKKNDRIRCTVRAQNRQATEARMAMVTIGIPPGFTPDTNDLDRLVSEGKVAKYELTERQVVFYLDRLDAGATQELGYALQARFAVEARSERSRVYEYYNPAQEAFAPPVEFKVE